MNKIRKILLYSLIIWSIFLYSNIKVNAEELINNTDNKEKEETNTLIGDINNDKLINYDDAENIIDNILEEKEPNNVNDVNQDNKLNINDATNIIYKEKTDNWDNKYILNDDLSLEMTKEEKDIYLGDEVNIDLYIKGFNKDKINGLESNLDYDKDKLQFIGIYNPHTKIKYGDINDKGKFIYLLDDYKEKDKLLTFKFQTLDIGYTNIYLKDTILSDNGLEYNLKNNLISLLLLINNKITNELTNNTTNNTINHNNRIISLNNNIKENNNTKENNNKIPSFAISDTGMKISITNIKLSSDNTIKSLIIKDHKINFNKDILTYNITVDSNTKKLDIKVVLNDSNATYEIIGNNNFKPGLNKVLIAVTAEDGSIKEYTINVKKEKEKEKKDNSKSSRNVIIVLLILIIIGLIYIIFKEDEEDNKEN